MSGAAETLLEISRKRDQAAEVLRVAAWAKRKAWTKTDTDRWLSDRSERVLGWVRRHRAMAPSHSHKMGYWLKEYDRPVFDRAHKNLVAAGTDDARQALMVEEVLR